MMARRFSLRLVAVITATALLSTAPSFPAESRSTDGTSGQLFSDGDSSGAGEATSSATGDGIELHVDVATPAGAATDGMVETAGNPQPAPEGRWIVVSDMDFVADPPCIRSVSTFIEGADAETAARIQTEQENIFVRDYEAYISSNVPPPPCPTAPGTPGIDATPARNYADDAAAILPKANPSISGGHAITGLRSWVDLGRDSTFGDSRELDLGPFTRTATFTATATTTVDWGDGTVTTHTSRGGGYHEGEPGPDDITHTYRDVSESTTLTVTDTWDVVVSVPGLEDIRVTYTADPVQLTYPVREVRSARDR